MIRLKTISIYIFTLLALMLHHDVMAQRPLQDFTQQDSIVAAWTDSLSALKQRFQNWTYEGSDTLGNPYYAPLFSAKAFSGDVGSLFSSDKYAPGTFSSGVSRREEAIGSALRYVYTEKPWLVDTFGEESGIPAITPGNDADKPVAEVAQNLKNEIEKTGFFEPEISIDVEKPNFWTLKANFSFQLMQNYVTDNWYKGGESNHSLLGKLVAEANYDNKRQIKFNNKLEMNLGFQSSNSDEVHKYKTNSDLLRLTNEFGIKAFKHWDYSAMLQSWTQFYRGYKKNDAHVYSDFMSPFESLLTLGMKYSLKKKNFELSVNISPLALDFKYVGRPSLITAMGLEEGKHSRFEYGSNITATHKWTIFKNIVWTGRFYYYTSYKRTQIEWENTIHLKVNKYLSTQLFLYPRFDDGVKRADEDASYFQFNEYLSVGLDVSF